MRLAMGGRRAVGKADESEKPNYKKIGSWLSKLIKSTGQAGAAIKFRRRKRQRLRSGGPKGDI